MSDLLIGRTGALPQKRRPAAPPAAKLNGQAPKSFKRPIDIYDRLPNFLLPNQRREVDPFHDLMVGHPVLLHLFVGTGEAESAGMRLLAERHAEISEKGIDIVTMVAAGLNESVALAEANDLPFDLFADAQARIRQRLGLGKGASGAPVTLALNGGLRVIGKFDKGSAETQIDQAIAAINPKPAAEIEEVAKQPVLQSAPVLLIENVIDPALCERLIEEWRKDNDEGVALTVGEDGREKKVIDYGTKRRRDHYIHDKKLLAKLNELLFERVAPMIAAAYDSDVTGIEEFKVTCYNANEGGYFRPHRDNSIPGRAHRRFAMSINLNDGFEGGDLRFPEFGPQSYRPSAGGAAIFACSLLHEVLDMREGQRFSLLTFLTDATADRRKAETKRWYDTEGRAMEQALVDANKA